ncbi:hypothetical protein ACJIZ3_015227 [Penstemon smallii]|uniref:Uncharacterized protein n=1 Tax=Penstemon smallii TaxID=265156 RepID=A0ABD3RMM9_9LAMI
MDFTFMDDLLYDGFWLETTADGSNFSFPSSDITTNIPSSFHSFPTNFSFSDNPSLSSNNQDMDEFSGDQQQNQEPPASFQVEDTEANKRLWVAPIRNPIRTISVKKKLVNAINHLRDSIRDKDVLIQIWVPVKKGGKQVLTTNNQPFSLNPKCKNLAEYRDVSRNYQFAADEDSKEFAGLPGRVFLNKLPEWTPDVRFFKREEYPRVTQAQQLDVRGSLALPVFEQGSGNCLGVVEIITTSQKVNYRPELENVCKALEAVDLKSSDVLSPPNVEDSNESYQAALREIRNVLKCVCETHKLPLAQTWAPCIQEGKGGCRHSDENYTRCVSTMDTACYVADPQVSGFHEACSEHHLLKGEGIAGKAFLTNQPCFAQDITAFSKTEYPLAHHARVFNLGAAVAIRLRSTYIGASDFVLEFFLPLNCKDADSQTMMLASLSLVIQQTCQSLRVVTDEELAREISARETGKTPLKEPTGDSLYWIEDMKGPQQKGKGVAVSLRRHKEEPEEFNVTSQWVNNPGLDLLQPDYGPEGSGKDSGNFSFSSGHLFLGTKTSSERRRAKTEKTISLQVLRQYFAGSLKDAAKSIGVCPTTLKRICRQHGISRWPSRKIKKVGHSLKKLQLVIDSVQGAEGSLQLSSFYNNFPELVSSPNEPLSSHLTTSKMSGHSQDVKAMDEGTLLSPTTTTTASKSQSSSGSHSSSSSYCCSTGVKQSSLPVNGTSSGETEGVLTRARSDAELHEMGQEETKLLVQSYSHKIFSDQASTETPPVPKDSSKVCDASNFRIKATFGEENIRLSLLPSWGFKDLQEEILRRFNIDNGSKIDLKYLDDDEEWVLLTCDADLEECIDIHRSSKSRTIKLSLNQAYHPSIGSSFGSNYGSF